jgi:hypothetical protein
MKSSIGLIPVIEIRLDGSIVYRTIEAPPETVPIEDPWESCPDLDLIVAEAELKSSFRDRVRRALRNKGKAICKPPRKRPKARNCSWLWI